MRLSFVYYRFKFLSLCLCLCFSLFVVAGCQSLPGSLQQSISVEYPQSEKLLFTGRGSAAAMMMSGSMGAMGIAIGVAIDEGLSKDLTASAMAGGFNAEQSFTKALGLAGYQAVTNGAPENALVIEKLGFRAKGDLIAPWVELSISREAAAKLCRYQEFAGEEVLVAELSELKTDGTKAAALLDAAIELTVSRCL